MNKYYGLIVCLFITIQVNAVNQPIQFDKSIIDTNPSAIERWQELKFGLFIHWGVYAIPAGIWQGEKIEKLGEQIQRHADISDQDYRNLASRFNPISFNANNIAKLAKAAGMKYIIFTAKHHDGFAMFDSRYSAFDIIDHTVFKRDIVKELAEAAKKYDLKLGIYYSTPDWHFNGPHPERNPVDGKLSVFSKVTKANEEFQVNQLTELMTNYGEIIEVFFDMGEPTIEQSKRFKQTIKKYQPNAVINGRIMNGQGDMLTFPDNHIPSSAVTSVPWESPGTFYHTWGHKSWLKGIPVNKQVAKQIKRLSAIISSGGNYLLNIGPNKLGEVLPYEQEVLLEIGHWLDSHKQAFFDVKASPIKKWPWGYITYNKDTVYFHIHHWPENNLLPISYIKNSLTNIHILSNEEQELPIMKPQGELYIDLTLAKKDPYLSIISAQFNKSLNIEPIAVTQELDGQFTLSNSTSINHGKLGFQSYRSYLKDYSKSWNIHINKTGCYRADIIYKLPFAEKDFVISTANQALAFTLVGTQHSHLTVSEQMDGNELSKEKINNNKQQSWTKKSLGTLTFEENGLQTFWLKQAGDFNEQSSMKAFKAQDNKYRKLRLNLHSINFSPCS